MSSIGDPKREGPLSALVERVGGTATALGAVVALITAVVAGGYKLYSIVDPNESSPRVLKANLKLTSQLPFTLGQYLKEVHRSGNRYSAKELEAEGELVYLGLEIEGAAKRHVSLQWSLFSANETGVALRPVRDYALRPLDDQLVAGISPTADDYRGIAKAWVPHPTGEGSYLARLELEQDRNTLAFIDTNPFSGADPLGFETPPTPITVPAVVQPINQ